ncbi:histidine ABC transporter substrate-binding protein [Rhizobium leguminosarum bv. viciae]|uniref:Substrate binding domain of ABC-type glycine betaine transport system family protein n=2 Tax=Rhizobium leguminosarum TaxID=384 RepID=A0A2Z4YNQ5_RHILE|nr:Substrate binding domain of ABC-type glycine betaine transport system family protein [Rhizobium leguminosarum]NKJ95483.1 histidine ABC transporter substrate-binding protein [Rhizobium leguminosarum bv. viciae]QIO58069.1 ABC transporter substrate-binding protein [Rhizobium leguminosarum bv. trifolii]
MRKLLKYAFCAVVLTMSVSVARAETSYCASGKTINFAEIGWESGAFITAVMKTILAKGYDCKVDTVPGNSVTLEQAAADGDVQISAEEWMGRSDVWKKAAAEGKVIGVGNSFSGAQEGWFVPDYLVHGDPARNIVAAAPDLKSVNQLADPKYVALFSDPEEPSKGRFLNCPSGWTCEAVSTAKLTAYHLQDAYVNFRPGTGTALDSAITSAYLQGQPILFYYWSPTAIMGKFKLVKLEEPAYSDTCWANLTSTEGKRDEGCAFPTTKVVYGVNAKFAAEAPEIIDILKKAEFPLDQVNASLAFMLDNKSEPAAAADEFLKTHQDIWGAWVSPEARAKIQASIN